MGATVDRTELWLPLLRRLTEQHPGWSIWKNARSAFAGTGDIDSLAPEADWPAIEATFEGWVAERPDLGPVIVCRHIPQGPHFITLQEGSPYIVQLDVKDRGTFRGSTLLDAQDLQRLSEIDSLGFRRIRPGAEGVIKLCMNGLRRGGRPNPEGLRIKGVAELLRSDPEGVAAAADLLGPAADALRRGAHAVAAGTWDARAMRQVDRWALLRSVAEPQVAASRLWFLYYQAARCPVVALIRNDDRRVPDDRVRWLQEVAHDHEVRDASDAPSGGGVPSMLPSGRGVHVVVAGPDGTGKSTVVDHLVGDVLSNPVLVMHHRPHLLGTRSKRGEMVSEPHREQAYPTWLSGAKLIFLWLDHLLGWLLRVRPRLLSGGDVIVERGWWDLAVDPRRYRLQPAPRLVDLLGRLLPRPDVTIVLGGDAATIAGRKAELSIEETERQLTMWRGLSTSRLRAREVDTSRPLDTVLASVRRLVVSAPDDSRWVLLPTTTEPRWYFPATPARAGVSALQLYHPVTPAGRIGWEAARGVAALGGFRLLARDGWRPPDEVVELLRPHLPSSARVAVARGRLPGRNNAMILDGRTGAALAFAKTALDAEGPATLAAEVEASEVFAPLLPVGLRAPCVLHHEANLVLFEPVAAHPRRRPWWLPPELAYLLGQFHRAGARPDGLGPAHGDFAPWNLVRTSTGWFVVDWSDAYSDAVPFEDVFHFLVQAHALLGRPGRQELLAAFRGRGRSGAIVLQYAEGAGLDVGEARRLIPGYLQRTLESIDRGTPDGRRGHRAREALLVALEGGAASRGTAETRPVGSHEDDRR